MQGSCCCCCCAVLLPVSLRLCGCRHCPARVLLPPHSLRGHSAPRRLLRLHKAVTAAAPALPSPGPCCAAAAAAQLLLAPAPQLLPSSCAAAVAGPSGVAAAQQLLLTPAAQQLRSWGPSGSSSRAQAPKNGQLWALLGPPRLQPRPKGAFTAVSFVLQKPKKCPPAGLPRLRKSPLAVLLQTRGL